MKIAALLVAALTLWSGAGSTNALCIYNGVDNAKTTISEEYRASSWVVLAKVISAKDHWSDTKDSWTAYDLEVVHAYKDHPTRHLRFFTARNSGGFYMDKPWVRLPAGHDIGGEYLLFLNPWPARKDLPREAEGAVFVNYSCGVSGSWAGISPADRRRLAALELGH